MVYCGYFHLIMDYGISFWGNSPYSINIFWSCKKAVGIITNTMNIVSCRDLYQTLNINPLLFQYIFSLLCSVVTNMDQYKVNLYIHSNNTRQSSNLHRTTSQLSLYQRYTYYVDITICNSLPFHIKDSAHNIKQLNLVLRISFFRFFLYIG
jgi:hypothetical protein